MENINQQGRIIDIFSPLRISRSICESNSLGSFRDNNDVWTKGCPLNLPRRCNEKACVFHSILSLAETRDRVPGIFPRGSWSLWVKFSLHSLMMVLSL